MLAGLFGYAMQLDDVCSTWSQQAATNGVAITSVHKFAQFAGIFSCLLGFAATLLLFLSFFMRSLLNKNIWRIALPTLLILAGVFQLCTFALADSTCKCPEGAAFDCVVTCTLQDGGNRSLAASVLYLVMGVSIIFYPRRTTPLIGFVHAPIESNKVSPDVEAPTTTSGAPVMPRVEEPLIPNVEDEHNSLEVSNVRLIIDQEQFNPSWEDTNKAGADVEAPIRTRECPIEPLVKDPFIANRQDVRESSTMPQGRVISAQDQFISSGDGTYKAGAPVEAPIIVGEVLDNPPVKNAVSASMEELHESLTLPHGDAIAGQELEDAHEFASLPHADRRTSSRNGAHHRGHGERVASRGHHRHRHGPREDTGQNM
jgi:hypothetical protein